MGAMALKKESELILELLKAFSGFYYLRLSPQCLLVVLVFIENLKLEGRC